MSKKQKKNLIRILIAAALLILLHFLPVEGLPRFALYLVPYLIVGYDVLKKAVEGIWHKQPFDEYLLMAIATVGAILLGVLKTGDYVEAIAVMLFYQIGEWFQSYAVGKSRQNIAQLMDIRPDYANIETDDGQLEQVDPDDVAIGTIIVIKPGEKVPIDGVVVEGISTLNTAALTGESLPRDVNVNDEIISGCINLTGVLKVRTTKDFGESTVAKILELIEDASSQKSKSEKFISKFAKVYTPIVTLSALALATFPALFLLAIGRDPQWTEWLYRALIFLVISCPCALVVSVPLSFFAGIGGASRAGILIKGANYLEILANIHTVVFDKTGTLTQGNFEVTAIHPEKLDKKELLHLAAHVERYSKHPIALSLREAYGAEADGCEVDDVKEIPGRGIRAFVNGKIVCVGNSQMMDDIGAKWHSCHRTGTCIHVAIDGEYAGHIVIADVIKINSKQAISELRKSGIDQLVMLTGDAPKVAESVSEELGLDHFYAGLLPAGKVQKLEELLNAKKSPRETLAFVGDGINDAPVLSRADIGIAMGALGSDAAIEAADIVLMDDDPLKIVTAIRTAKKCMRIVKENITFSLAIKIACLLLGALGFANMWMAIFADVGVMVLAVLNAARNLWVSSVNSSVQNPHPCRSDV
ncbi:MAG: cadmium-translocating P-type ATPase [Fibrobacter sp.]|nr:cadmium-translocating P-type ATPase [Fibrobacter sp.]